LVSDGRLVFQSSGNGKLYDVLVKVYGLEMAKQLLLVGEATDDKTDKRIDGTISSAYPFSSVASQPQVAGYVGAPALHRGNRGYITLFVNRRWFQDSSIAYGVIQAYHTLLPTGRYPVALIFIEMDPADLDVNVHPTKAEVRFRDSHAVFSAVQRAVRRTLTEHVPVAQVGIGGEAQATPRLTWEQLEAWSTRREALLGAGDEKRFVTPQPGTDSGQPAPDFTSLGVPNLRAPLSPLPVPPDLKPQMIPLLRVVGQLGATYIVAEGPDGMYLIDQHAAHERVLYEGVLAAHAGGRLAVQPLLEPVVLDLSPEQAAVVAEELQTLNDLGVAIEPFGGHSYLVRSVPAVLNTQNPQSALVEIVDGLARGEDVVEGTREARLVTLICKRAAIKAGQTLSMAEMQEMVRQLEGCHSPRTCPHGRPTMIYLSAAELARQFGRV
jgi:DNA mismatch repair protein MutL